MTQDLVRAPHSATPIPTLLDEATRLHAAGQIDAAQALYKEVLSRSPREAAALHGLGLIAVDEGIADKALPFLITCLQIAPDNAIYRTSLGLAFMKLGKVQDAAAQFLDAANRRPNLAEPRIHLARALARLGRGPEALRILAETAQSFPGRADVWIAKGQEERTQLKPAEAERSLRRALELLPNEASILNDLGVVVRAQGRTRDAVEIYLAALKIAPSDPLTHGNLGNALTELKDLEAAEEHLRLAVALAPGSVEHRCNLAIFLTREDRPQEAVILFRDVLMRAPGHADAWTNLGVAQLDLGDVADAEASIRKAVSLAPDNAEAHYNLAWVLLLTGQWDEGWREYEWRWRMRHFSSKRRSFTAPLWDGAPIAGTLLLHAEQGMGDAIQFVRYAAQAKTRCARLVLECPKPLVRLFQTVSAVDAVIAAGDALPDFAAHAPLMSLPRIFGSTPETVPARTPYLTAPPPRAGLTLAKNERRRIGLVWAGSPDNKIDKRRTLPAALFTPLIEETAADFVSLQVGPKSEDVRALPQERLVLTCNGAVADFADTASVISQLDLVIGVDTAAIHLAGALGVPVWVLLPKMPDYRWLLGRDDSPWYPSMLLFRQEESGDWAAVMWRVRAALTLLQSSS